MSILSDGGSFARILCSMRCSSSCKTGWAGGPAGSVGAALTAFDHGSLVNHGSEQAASDGRHRVHSGSMTYNLGFNIRHWGFQVRARDDDLTMLQRQNPDGRLSHSLDGPHQTTWHVLDWLQWSAFPMAGSQDSCNAFAVTTKRPQWYMVLCPGAK